MKVTKVTSGMAWCAKLLQATLLSLLLLPTAQADIWGYIDERGRAHFAPEQIDERYELFYRVGEAGVTRTAAQGKTDQAVLPELTPRHKLVVFFEVSPEYKQVKHLLREASQTYQIDIALLQAVIAIESAFDATAVSPKGAVGLMQIMPATARGYGVTEDRRRSLKKKLVDPRTNIDTGARLLRDLLDRYPGQLDLALAAYNAGPTAVARAGNRVPDYRETTRYVRTIMQLYEALRPPTLVSEQRNARARMQM